MYYTKGQKKKYPPRGTVNIVFRTSCHAGSGRNTNTSAAHLVTVSPFAQETFSVSQTDQHSDLTDGETLPGVTVMAVAADSHRDFLIPDIDNETDNAHLLCVQ